MMEQIRKIGDLLHPWPDDRFCAGPPICISYHFVLIHRSVDHSTWTRCVEFTHEYSGHTCVIHMHDKRVVLNCG